MPKLRTSDPTIIYHPSTNTKKIILNGSAIIIGGNIIMPIAISTDATTMSMIKNGKKTKKPISKARLNSDIMKAGTRTRSDKLLARAVLGSMIAMSAN